jgi:HAD superfamily hydrolase (TIGR01459 family)
VIPTLGLADLMPRYDVFLLDQFGTLHDGSAPYPGVRDSLEMLKAAGKRLVLLSNSGKRATDNLRRLARLGFPETLFETAMTSGEAARALLATGRIEAARDARRCLLLERDGDGSLLDGLDLSAASADQAELVLIAGSEGERRPLAEYETQLAPLARAGVPALCLNPDKTMLTPRGPAFGAGRIAELYQQLGGAVTWIGKPYPAIYDSTLEALGNPPRERVAAVGDSIEHDIAGARAAGCGAWLVRTGIAAGLDDAAILAECLRYGATPDGIVRMAQSGCQPFAQIV